MDRVTRLDRAEQILVVVDPEVGMVTALHQETGAADRQRLFDLLEDDRLGQDVALARVAGAAVERAEVAVRVADVRVVQVAVDYERDARRIDLPVAQLVRGAPDGDEVARFEQRKSAFVGDALPVERLVQYVLDAGGQGWGQTRAVAVGAGHAGTASRTKR